MDIIQSIQTILAVVAVVIVNIVGIVKGVSAIVQQIKAVQAASAEEKEAAKAEAKAAIIGTLRPIIFGWVSDAEKELGGGTGKLKSAKVAGLVYEKIPDDLKPLFSAQEIQAIIDDVLRDAQNYWNKNSKAREYIEAGTALLTAEVSTIQSGASVEDIVQAVADGINSAIGKATEKPQDGPQPPDGETPALTENVAEAAADVAAEGPPGPGDGTP